MAENLRQRYDATIAYLSRARELDAQINARFERIEQLRSLATRRTRVYGREGVRGGGSPDGRMDVVARIVDAERELDEQIDALVTLKRELEGTIARVPQERMRELLELRYLNLLSWEQIAERMNYSVRNIYNLHSAALKLVTPLIDPASLSARALA